MKKHMAATKHSKLDLRDCAKQYSGLKLSPAKTHDKKLETIKVGKWWSEKTWRTVRGVGRAVVYISQVLHAIKRE